MRNRVTSVWNLCLRVLRTVLAVWITVVVILAFIQRKLMYQPTTAESLLVANYPYVMQLFPDGADVRMSSTGSQTIRGWFLCQEMATAGSRPLVLLFHGNAGNRAGRTAWYEILAECGCDVLAIDYQGYGDSTGSPSQTAIEDDAQAAWDYAVRQLGYTPNNIFVMGISLGGAAAVHLASVQSRANAAPAGVMTVATFSSMVDVAAWWYPWIPVRAVLLDRYPSANKIADVTSPMIQLHGDSDRVVDQSFGRQLFESAPAMSATGVKKRWVSLANVGHNDLVTAAGTEVIEELTAFQRSVAAASEER